MGIIVYRVCSLVLTNIIIGEMECSWIYDEWYSLSVGTYMRINRVRRYVELSSMSTTFRFAKVKCMNIDREGTMNLNVYRTELPGVIYIMYILSELNDKEIKTCSNIFFFFAKNLLKILLKIQAQSNWGSSIIFGLQMKLLFRKITISSTWSYAFEWTFVYKLYILK